MYRSFILAGLVFVSCTSVGKSEINGTYQHHIEDGIYSTLVVEMLEKDNVYITMDCQYGSPNFNSGMVEKTLIKLNGNKARYHKVFVEDEPCIIDIEFSSNKAIISQTSGYGASCGFGMKVMCNGIFYKK